MRAEPCQRPATTSQANAVEYMDLDRSATIAQALRGKDIVEFPTFLVVPPETLGEFTLHAAA